MSDAIEIAHGPFGRVALLDMDRGLVRHAHPHCHVLLKVEGDDTQFLVGERVVSLTDAQAVLVNAWETHSYVHDPRRDKAIILALYIEPIWLGEFRTNWAASGAPGFFAEPIGAVTQMIRRFAHDLAAEMVSDPDSSRIQNDLLPGLMVSALERFTAWREIGTSLRDLARRNSPDHRIRRAVAKMKDEPGLLDGVEALARDAGLSRAHFYRLFEQSTGAPASRLSEWDPHRACSRGHRPGTWQLSGDRRGSRLRGTWPFLALFSRPFRRVTERLPCPRPPGRQHDHALDLRRFGQP